MDGRQSLPPAGRHLGLRRIVAGAEGQVLDPVGPGLHLAHRALREADRVPLGEFDDLVLDLDAGGAADDDVDLLLGLVLVAERDPEPGLEREEAQPERLAARSPGGRSAPASRRACRTSAPSPRPRGGWSSCSSWSHRAQSRRFSNAGFDRAVGLDVPSARGGDRAEADEDPARGVADRLPAPPEDAADRAAGERVGAVAEQAERRSSRARARSSASRPAGRGRRTAAGRRGRTARSSGSGR